MQAHPQSSSAARIFTPAATISPSPSKRTELSPQTAADGGVSSLAGRKPSLADDSCPVSEGPGLAHDAGNLLHGLGLYCELLQKPGVLRPEHKHYATELRQLHQRSSTMILRLLKDFAPQARFSQSGSSIESPTLPSPVPPSASGACLNPAEVLHGQSALLQRLAAPWAKISVATQDPLPGLEFSAEILERIAVNLVLNAAEALKHRSDASDTRESSATVSQSEGRTQATDHPLEAAPEAAPGRIRVSLRMAAGRLRLSVEDNGPGMPPAIAAAFLRPSPLPAGAARGLGHRIVHELAEATGGQLSIRVRPGAGTTLSLDWPVKLATASSTDGPTLRLVSSQCASTELPRGEWTRTKHGGPDAC